MGEETEKGETFKENTKEMKSDLTYKIDGSYKYPTNYHKIDDGGIGVEFVMNGSIYLFKKPIPDYLENEDIIKNGYWSRQLGGMIKLDPRDCLFFRVNKKTDKVNVFEPTDEIIYPTKSIIGTCKEYPKVIDNSSEAQRFQNIMYRSYTYDEYWDEGKSGINLEEFKGMCYLDDEHWIKDRHFKKTKRKDGNGYYYDSNNVVFEPRKFTGSREGFRLGNVHSNRKAVRRELRLSKILN
ncbi:MAG: hypothetical protein SLAVMIC_01021 [uncultured marine phage]|uniref:Uncharacterized protein n=1 Tax=uncultured marine phage TaxID=707152 RepID=A0A8D9CD54_9VIRU|nr:MAG: hypothetical protein SLAVMIC_01021 [uncultured marine phage]